MKISVRRSCISLIVLSALVETIRANENGTNGTNETLTAEGRRGRVSGRIIKLYSGYKPDPILCTEEGFKADPVQCSVFYRCLKSSNGKFTVFKFQCGPGTVYDPETEVCNHPGSTKRSECGGIKSHVEQDNENDIAQHELPSPISTIAPVYTSANRVTGYTTYKVPSLSSSTENGYINYFTAPSTSYHIGSTTKKVEDINNNLVNYPWTDYNNTTQQKITSSTTILPILERNQPCTSDGFMGDSENCKKFYRCISNLRGGFIRYEFQCSEPTVWDDHLQSCNHPWAVRNRRCGRDSTYNENYTQISHFSNNMPTKQKDVSYGVKIPETSNQESNNISIQKEPSSNYGNRLNNVNEYNPEKNQIGYGSPSGDYPTMPNNDKNIETEENIQIYEINNNFNFGQKTTTNAAYSTNKLAENSGTQLTEVRKNIICTQSGFVGDSIDCKKFYRCVENGKGSFTKYEFTCSEGTVWDKTLEACNYAWAVKDCGGASAGGSLITTDSLTSSTSTSATVLSENDDIGYINHSNEEREPPSTITVSTPVSLISTTAGTNQIRTKCSETGFIGDKNDCKKFYRCVDNGRGTFTKYEYKCGDGTLWDQNIEACNHAWAVPSCNSALSNSTMHITSETTAKTHTTAFLIQSTTEKLLDNNDYSDAYRPELDAALPNSEIDLHKTTVAPMINQNNDCNSTGFKGDNNDCKKFYRCVSNGQNGFIKYEFSCGEGTVWDPEIEACNHAWSVKHCGSSIPLKDEAASSSIDNTHSSTNTHDLGVTTAISPIHTSTPQKEIDDYDSGYGQPSSESSKSPNVDWETTTPKQTLGQKNVCQTTGFIGDINNCNKFYRCVDNGNGGFIKHEFSCGEGTVWDPEIEACNHAWAVKHCAGSMPSTENILTSSSTNLNVESNNGYITNNNFAETTTSPSSTATWITVTNTTNECKSSGFIGDNSDCQKFYRCVDNGNGGFNKHEFMCGEGTVWDSKIEACNYKWAVEKCGGDSHNEFIETTTHLLQPTSPVPESVTTSTLYSSTTISTTTSISPLPSLEDRECSSEGYFANTNDCKKFYRCVNEGKDGYSKYEFSCAEGTAWDVKTQSCNYISKVEACNSNKHPVNTTETKPVHDEQMTELDTTKSTTLGSTISSSTTLASTTVKSTTSGSTTENPKPAGQNTCKDEGYFGDKNDCKKFYRCVHENNGMYTKYDFTCGDGTIWDQDIIACNHPRDVKNPSCKSEPESTSPISTSSTTTDNNESPSSVTTDKPSTNEVASNKNDTNSNCSNTASEHYNSENFTCSKAGFYADPSNCKKFYRCVDWENNDKKFSIYHFECADGTIWDPALETCNHENSVYPPRNCNSTQVQAGNTSGTSSTTEQITTTKQTESTTTSPKPTKTTTQSTTTSEYSSTQTTQSSTTEESTQSSTTEESTTKSSTTEESTTQSSTTEESTTQSSTTEESTTQTSTTQSSTTEESTTQSSTTQSSTTEESTTQSSTTQSTIEESTTSTTNEQTTSTTQMTTSATDQTSATTEPTSTTTGDSSTTEASTKKECPDTANDQSLYVCPTSFKRHPKYCNLFYQCTEDSDSHELKIAVFNCPNNTIYDETKIQCVAENKSSKKCNGQISQKHTLKQLDVTQNNPFVVTKESMACQNSGHFPFEKNTECSSSLLKCELTKSGTLRGFVYRCPDGFVYWNISRRCEPINKVRDCKRSSYPWKRRYDIPLERFNIAP